MKINTKQVKDLLTKSKLPDADFVINPYIGCNHGCIYCYARFISRFTGHAGERWGSFIDVKKCSSIGKVPDGKTVLIGSVTDPYNPLEKKYKITREVLDHFTHANDVHVEVLTKSPLVLRDIDLIRQISNIRIGISLSTLDPYLAKITETHVAPPIERVQAMRELHDAGVIVYAFVSPIFPYLSDWKAVAATVAPFVEATYFENLNLRGEYRKTVLGIVHENFPDQYDQFAAVYSDKASFNTYWNTVEGEIETFMAGKQYKTYFFHDEIKKKGRGI